MASSSNSNNILTTDIYKAAQFVDRIKAKYVDVAEDTLYLGMFGYMNSIFQNLVQNTAAMTADYAAEAIPTKAKFEKNVIAHALSLGITDIFAKPAEVSVILAFSEDGIDANMETDSHGNSLNRIIIDKDAVFYIGETDNYPYLLDYDILLTRVKLPGSNEYTYTAKYQIDSYGKNQLADYKNPYLPAVGSINVDNTKLIALFVTLRQLNHSVISKDIIVNNPFETMSMTFEFQDQLAYFYVEVEEKISNSENTTYHYLEPIYEGIYTYNTKNEYINYMYLDEKTIRIKFNRNSYQPSTNAEVSIHVYTTLGEKCNFSLAEGYQIIRNLVSENYSYNALYYLMRTVTDSQYARNKYSVETLKQFIPKESLSRGSITSYTDLNNYFNSIQTEDCKLYFLDKINNQIDRIYYCYLLMKYNDNVIPTNTITVNFTRNDFSSISQSNFTIKPGCAIFQPFGQDEAYTVTISSASDVVKYESQGFLYVNPLMLIINKTPLFVAYMNTNISYTRELYFENINENSELQFVAGGITVYKNYFNNSNNEFHVRLPFTQNVNVDYDLISFDSSNEIEQCLISVYLALYNPPAAGESISKTPYRYIEGTIESYDISKGEYTFDFCIKTNYKMSNKNTYMYFNNGLKEIKTGNESPTYLYKNMIIKFFFVVRMTQEYSRSYTDSITNEVQTIDNFFPNLEGYTLTNIYNTGDAGLDIFYDYTNIMSSYVKIVNNTDSENAKFCTHKVPVVRYSWWHSTFNLNTDLEKEERIKTFFKNFDYRRRYIQDASILLEDSFGLDYKLYNTYGKSKMYMIDSNTYIDRVNESLKFEIKFITKEDQIMLSTINKSIKDYIEDMTSSGDDVHMPNLVTYIKNLYNDNIEYIKFIKLNNYSNLYQSIYKDPNLEDNYFQETQTVPEFININSTTNEEPDIQYVIKY